jgi:ribose transport system ATP-binding protein
VLRGLFGGRPGHAPDNLRVKMHGKPVNIDSPRAAIRAGIALVPEERASQGLILGMAVERNIALASLRRFRLENEEAIAEPFMKLFGIRGGGLASMLSGGNQQKIVLSKWMALSPTVLLLDEPTRGLDIKAKRDVHEVVRKMASEGKGIIVSSSEADEIAAVCHRALVLSRGVIAGELQREELTDANILKLAA